MFRQINATESDAQLYARLASSIIFANPLLRADPPLLLKITGANQVYGVILFQAICRLFLLQIEDQPILNW